MKHLFSLLVAVLMAAATHAQGVLQFEKVLHDFGKVPEGTMATYEFKFKNTGNQPVIIADVQASCGCTTPDWTKTPVLPGKTGIVKAVYSSSGRPGIFNKTVTVTSNAATPSTVLTIKGNVLNKDQIKATLTPAQLAQGPRLVLDQTTHDFGKMEAGQAPTARFTIKNTGKQDLVLSAIQSQCYCVGYKSAPAPIKPGQSAVVELIYNQRKLGLQEESVTITSNDMHGDTKLTLKANVVKDLNAGSMVKESGSSVPFK
ncbi:Protein of unknown function [Hymenobacter gelipurpurascens]|uniref:DUF1573 domain-containing protein n=1 Tax=Hymenobacter gelipurpurascens TaxID=89968 RepID=A0A212TJE3_9BACT|nr:DUF1573 domain-containing protein [Hymenobacter gelipurpurascens]SNC65954.1 Protein of unknown function [Hymenobacter gelipurpurascens]